MNRILTLAVSIALFAFTSSAQDWAKARIANSPRHNEWVKVKHGDREVNCYITYPEVKDKATAVIVIHEIFGLTDWARSVTDELAEAGYIAIAPDLLWSTNGGTEEMVKRGETVGKAIQALPADQITADLNAVLNYVTNLPSCNGKGTVSGFCWGGKQSFRFATNNKGVQAAFVFYGDAPAEADMVKIGCPVYGFYGGNDNRITSTVPKTTEQMKAAKKTYEPVVYDGAGHGFMRGGEAPNATDGDKKAHDDAWKRWKDLLKKM